MERRLRQEGIKLYRLVKVMVKLNAKLLFPTLHPSKHTDTIPGAALQCVRVPKRSGTKMARQYLIVQNILLSRRI